MKRDSSQRPSWIRVVAQRCLAALFIVLGATMLWFGVELLGVGGSPYYAIAGATIVASGVLLWRGRKLGARLYGAMLIGTWLWALWEVGLDLWALIARVGALTILGLTLLSPWAYERSRDARRGSTRVIPVAAAILIALLAVLATQDSKRSTMPTLATASASESIAPRAAIADAGDWAVWGGDLAGQRFSSLAQITPENVSALEKAWEYRTGYDATGQIAPFEATPIKIGAALYLCTPGNDVIALDAETGAELWRFEANAARDQASISVCRGVAYYRSTSAQETCQERIISTTIDARLIALDARTGRLCDGFGSAGVVDLKRGLSLPARGYYYVTSAPAIVRGRIIFGGLVPDNRQLGSPSGVIRAYDAETGAFAWAFDVGRPHDQNEPEDGQTYTPGTPNSWAPISADEELGLVYLPTGNATPDWYGGQRRPFDEEFSSAVVALEAQTGRLRWVFQTTHHDIWDYDLASQPTLYDFPLGERRVPALIQATKRGEIFVLDRRTGEPLVSIEERAVPQSDVPGERTAPTQPFSTGMPSIAGPALTENMMWGLTPIDQAWCRIEFRKSGYRGPLTPVRVNEPTLIYPGYSGGIEWGGVAVDRERDLMVVNSLRLAIRAHLIPRDEADRLGLSPEVNDPGGRSAQAGTPYAVALAPFLSPLKVPCQQPPWGLIGTVDLTTRKKLWERPFGTARESGPWGLRSRLPFEMGVPHLGGALVTRSGLTFVAASQDRRLRAIETRTGNVLWSALLPAGGQANPMTYSSPSGRQFVVIAAGGHPGLRSKRGDYVVAYALRRDADVAR
jgi:quinoprotein glucose dehydrogenase